MIGSEQSRAPNLRRIEAGRPDLLQREKVADEAAALNGDLGLWPADRYYARAGEDPGQGVFTGPEEGVIPNAGGAYRRLTGAVNNHLNNSPNGRSLRDRTADIWVGMRETAKGNELFGQRMVGSAIPGPSVGYEQHFNDLVREKAKFLGISEAELRRRLASGRGDLLAKGGRVRVGALSR